MKCLNGNLQFRATSPMKFIWIKWHKKIETDSNIHKHERVDTILWLLVCVLSSHAVKYRKDKGSWMNIKSITREQWHYFLFRASCWMKSLQHKINKQYKKDSSLNTHTLHKNVKLDAIFWIIEGISAPRSLFFFPERTNSFFVKYTPFKHFP